MCHIEMVANRDGAEAASAHPVHVTYQCQLVYVWGATPWNGNWMIYCDGGYLEMVDNKVYAQIEDDGPKESLTIEPMELTDQAYLLRAFYEAVRDGKEPETSAEDNLRSIEMVFRTVESCETRQTIPLTGGGAALFGRGPRHV